MAYTAVNYVPAYIGNLVVQASHGFSVGQVLQLNGSVWQLAKADTLANAMCVGIVSSLPAANPTNTFVITQVGWVYQLSGLSAGSLYYLSGTTAGALTTTPGPTQVPLFYADTSTSGYFMNSYPSPLSGGGFNWVTLTTATPVTMVPNTAYICDCSTAECELVLPVSFNVGATFMALSYSNFGFTIGQNNVPAQSIIFNSSITTAGSMGGITTTTFGDVLVLSAVEANTQLMVTNSPGSGYTIV